MLVFGLFFGALPVEASAETVELLYGKAGDLQYRVGNNPESNWDNGEENAIVSTNDDIRIIMPGSGGRFVSKMLLVVSKYTRKWMKRSLSTLRMGTMIWGIYGAYGGRAPKVTTVISTISIFAKPLSNTQSPTT